jgi:hypothetical protein
MTDRETRNASHDLKNVLTFLSQSSAYGKCIFADYNNVHKDKCVTEFLKLKECFVVSSKIRDQILC